MNRKKNNPSPVWVCGCTESDRETKYRQTEIHRYTHRYTEYITITCGKTAIIF